MLGAVPSMSVAIFVPDVGSHTTGPLPSFTVSALVVTTHVPSGEKATPLTTSECDPSVLIGSRLGHVNVRTSPFSRPTASEAPSGENAAHLTSHVSSRVTRFKTPSESTSRGEIVYGADASGDGASDSSVSASCVDASLAVMAYTATSPLNATRSSAPSGCTHSTCGAVSSVCTEARGSVSSTPSNVASITRFGMPLLFLPPPPATSGTRSSIHADA